MAEPFSRICVFGSGAVGSFLAASLARAGLQVHAIARGPHLDAIQRHGLRVLLHDSEFTANVAATDRPEDLGPQDLVLITVKAPTLSNAVSMMKPMLHPKTAVVCFINGIPWWYFHAHGGLDEGRRLPLLDPDGVIWDTLRPERTIGGVIYCPCNVVTPGVVKVMDAGHRFEIGEPNGAISERIKGIAAVLQASGLTVETRSRIRDDIWNKLVLNLATGPLSILSGSPQNKLHADPACAHAMRALMQEGIAIAAAMGIQVSVDVEGHLSRLAASTHKPSILQDLERSRPMEIDALYSLPLEMARRNGVATPLLELLTSLVRLRAANSGLYAR
jgi:2-dehydropantoate 2-reductase